MTLIPNAKPTDNLTAAAAQSISTTNMAPAKSLSKVLNHSERVQDIVAECAEELSAVNGALKQELAVEQLPRVVGLAIEKSEAIETKVQAASEELTVVNVALQGEIGARLGLQTKLAEVTEQKDAALYAALHDQLTGLPNRALFQDRLNHALVQAGRHGWTLAVLFIDLDKFKLVNDTHGHAAGDTLLIAIANALKAAVRADDTISRYGGDEFLALLTYTSDEKMVLHIAEKMLHAIKSAVIVEAHNVNQATTENHVTKKIRVDASIGIALYPADGITADALIDAADKAMYRVKQNHSVIGFA
jgi:diguanylate cyclase (GGDEF)-like protein